MSIAISAIILFLISFWVLGYIYQQNNAQMSVSQRKFNEKINSLNKKINALEKEKKIYQKKISSLDEELKKIKKKIEDIEEKNKLKLD
ncbi:hypothetical protein [Desulfothermus sp.]